MAFHVVVAQQVSKTLGAILSRGSLLVVLNRLYDQLENHADNYRSRRDPDDPDFFDYVLQHHDGLRWHTLRFSVDDRQATGYLFVTSVRHRPGKTH